MRESTGIRSPGIRIRPGPIRAAIFDLDGTLIDSLPAIAGAVDAVRAAHRLPAVRLEAVREAIGDGARVLIGRIFEDASPEKDLAAIHREFLEEYVHRTAAQDDPWRPGARDLLDTMRSLGVVIAILSNKPLFLTEEILERTGTRSLFAAVRGPENSPAPKPDPSALTDLIEALGVPRDACVFVGDSVVDFETGRGAGVETIGIRGGYRGEGDPPPDHWLTDPNAVSHWFVKNSGDRNAPSAPGE